MIRPVLFRPTPDKPKAHQVQCALCDKLVSKLWRHIMPYENWDLVCSACKRKELGYNPNTMEIK